MYPLLDRGLSGAKSMTPACSWPPPDRIGVGMHQKLKPSSVSNLRMRGHETVTDADSDKRSCIWLQL